MRRSKRVPIAASGRDEAGLREYYCATHIMHAGNKSEFFGRPFYLEEWQRKNIWNPIFGTGRMVGKGDRRRFVRRYREALIGLPRDYGKTELICAMMLSEANVRPVSMGQYGVIAYSKEQARKILATLGAMIRQDPDMFALWDVGKTEITNRESGAVIKVFPYSEGAIQSWHFNFLIADELHVWKDSSVWNAIVSGMGNVENSLVVAITTAGASRRGFLWDWLNGNDITSVLEDPAAYCWWLGAEDEDGIDDPRVWRRLAVPSWVSVDNIRMQRRRLSRADFERYVLNRFPVRATLDRSMREDDVEACEAQEAEFDFDEPFTLAVDGAVRGDAFALVAHQVGPDGHSRFREWVYDSPPEDTGYYDIHQVGQLVAGLSQRYGCPVGIDPARLLLWANVLQDEYGVEVYEVRQTNLVMCPACSLVVNAVRSHRADLGGCPRLAEHLRNCRDLPREPYGTRFTSVAHGQGSERIDAAIAAAMAMWMTQTMPEPVESFAETGGIWTI